MSEPLVIIAILLVLALLASWYLLPGAWASTMLRSARKAARVTQRRHDVGDVHWRYLEGGDGPVLVMLHGFAAAGDHWLGIAGQLRGHFRLLIPDLPGFGLSSDPENTDFAIPAQAQRVWDWLDSLGVEQCILAGSSMGGWIACQCAAQRPDRVEGLWLQDPLGVSSSRISELMAAIERGERNPFSIESTDDAHQLARVMLHRRPPSVFPILKSEVRRTRCLRPHLQCMQAQIMGSTPIEKLAPALVMPALVEWGERDRAVDVSGAGILETCLPRAEVHVHANVGHLPMLETPIKSARLFVDFCRRSGFLT